MIDSQLLNKYNIPVPRYTSYPTVPFWNSSIDQATWTSAVKEQFAGANKSFGISLYIHLPFCESLCTYCGCNKKITTNHGVEEKYMGAILKEWNLYLELLEETPLIREIHLGGGTPTFFSPENLHNLVSSILEKSKLSEGLNFSLEGHPNNTTKAHLEQLYNLGFRRISYGVQDNDPSVQKIINRIQPFENVIRATETARQIGYTSVNFDLIYGLPLQTPDSIRRTLNQCISLLPDRVAFYSYAHVPWTSRGQRLFDETDLPSPIQKNELYRLGKQIFGENGYQDIGMDHFALKSDDLYLAWKNGSLHRNFMGYTTHYTNMTIGLGVSAISDSGNAFMQNSKSIHDYYSKISSGNLAIERGHLLNSEDQVSRKYILDISCRAETQFQKQHIEALEQFTLPELRKLERDGLVRLSDDSVVVTPMGRNFIRNICRAFDLHLLRQQFAPEKKVYSQAI